jgi:galactosyl transferase GMA12/MNN10 family
MTWLQGVWRLLAFVALATSLIRFVFFNWNWKPAGPGFADIVSKVQLILQNNQSDSLDKYRIALIMFDTRDDFNGTYWFAAAQWNSAYCERHGHRFVYYTRHNSTSCLSSNTSVELNPVWCKVKAMKRAQQDLGDKVDFFFYVDSDAVIAEPFANVSLNELLSTMTLKLHWNTAERPFVFNQEGSSYWCNIIQPSRYFYCLNTGTVVWRSSQRATQVLERWWESALDPYETQEFTADNKTIIRFPFRTDWPWEQDRATFIVHANDTIASFIQVAPQPKQRELNITLGRSDWCLSHIPISHCFFAHCHHDHFMKETMGIEYTNYSEIYYNVTSAHQTFDVTFLD